MKNFTYYRPGSAEAAVSLLEPHWGIAELLAGGTDLIGLQKDYVSQPEKIISLGGMAGLSGIKVDDKQVRIGAGTTLAEIAEHAEIRKRCPGLAEAAGDIGGPQIRNMGTLGGNLCQRNRCWYFRDEHTQCLLKGGDKCFALDGDNRYHALFAQGHACVIVSPSTLAPILIALDGNAEVIGPKGKRTLGLNSFFHAPRSDREREHVLEPNEVVLAVNIPSSGLANASYEVRHKLSYDWPLVQAAVAFKHEGGKASDVKIVLGHVAPTPHVATAAAQAIEGKEVTEESAAQAGKAAADGAKPLAQTGYKVKLVEVAVKRALLIAAGQKKYWEV
jgi:xanthine dehydrogenase YagS FAD-binding subunit